MTVIIARRLNPIAPGERYCSPQQAAEVMGVSEWLLYHEIEQQQILHRHIGARILIPVDWVKAEAKPRWQFRTLATKIAMGGGRTSPLRALTHAPL